MLDVDGRTIDQVFAEAAARWPEADFLVTPQQGDRPLRSLSFRQVAEAVTVCADALRQAGFGPGHRAAVLLGTCPEHYIVHLALARLGMSCVPINPDYHPSELAYVLEDSGAVIAIVNAAHAGLMEQGIAAAKTAPAMVMFEEMTAGLPAAPTPAATGPVTSDSEAGLLYTSGTTGHPKGCILSHEYMLMCGASYAGIGAPMALRAAADRVLNPLPSFHINAGILTFFGVMITGNCLIQPARFSKTTWWRDIRDTRATVFHYLGVVISVLMADPDAGPDDLGDLRVGMGAGAEPALHVAFEQRFGIPLVECWGMTEMCRVTAADREPRMIDTRAMGRGRADLQVRIVDGDGAELPRGTPGEMVLRHSEETPRKGFFSGYLNKPEATDEAWRGGWFHTGDTVVMDDTGMLFFVDRAKNIIRRSGENIAAAEVENCLFNDPRVANVACIAAPDEIREEEVMACVVLAPGVARSEQVARSLFDHAAANMAYYKPPGWMLFVDELPVTGTQKVMKHMIFPKGVDPRQGAFDFRALKKRG